MDKDTHANLRQKKSGVAILPTGKSRCQSRDDYQVQKWTVHILFVIPWTVAHQTRLSMEFSRQEYWSRKPFPSPGDLSNPRIKPRSPALQAYSLPSEPPGKSKEDWGCYQNDMHLIVQIQHLGFVRPTFKELLLLSMYHDDHLLDCIFWGYI